MGNVKIAGRLEVEGQITAKDGIVLANKDEKPACDEESRGKIWFTKQPTGDSVEICILNKSSAYLWQPISWQPPER